MCEHTPEKRVFFTLLSQNPDAFRRKNVCFFCVAKAAITLIMPSMMAFSLFTSGARGMGARWVAGR